MDYFLYYAVRQGVAPRVYDSWRECEPVVRGHSYAVYKGFNSPAKAEKFIQGECVCSSCKRDPKWSYSFVGMHFPKKLHDMLFSCIRLGMGMVLRVVWPAVVWRLLLQFLLQTFLVLLKSATLTLSSICLSVLDALSLLICGMLSFYYLQRLWSQVSGHHHIYFSGYCPSAAGVSGAVGIFYSDDGAWVNRL